MLIDHRRRRGEESAPIGAPTGDKQARHRRTHFVDRNWVDGIGCHTAALNLVNRLTTVSMGRQEIIKKI